MSGYFARLSGLSHHLKPYRYLLLLEQVGEGATDERCNQSPHLSTLSPKVCKKLEGTCRRAIEPELAIVKLVSMDGGIAPAVDNSAVAERAAVVFSSI